MLFCQFPFFSTFFSSFFTVLLCYFFHSGFALFLKTSFEMLNFNKNFRKWKLYDWSSVTLISFKETRDSGLFTLYVKASSNLI